MMIGSTILFLLIHSINLNPVVGIGCDVCELNRYFNSSNGYECILINNNETRCTCPDQQFFTTNRPCRICQRAQICGPVNALCSEDSTYFSSDNNKTFYFACFCSSGLFHIGEKCLEEITTSTIESITDEENNTTVTIPSSTTTECKCPSESSHLFIEPILIILLNLVYFLHK